MYRIAKVDLVLRACIRNTNKFYAVDMQHNFFFLVPAVVSLCPDFSIEREGIEYRFNGTRPGLTAYSRELCDSGK